MTDKNTKSAAWLGMRQDWQDQVKESAIDPQRRIIDPHHHLWTRDGAVYELSDLLADTGSGHNVKKTIFIECRSAYDLTASEYLQPVGETKYAAGFAAQAAQISGAAQIAGIVAFADLRNPALDDVLDAHLAAGGDLFKGIRQAGARDSDPGALMIPGRGYENQYSDPAFRAGVARLGERGLTYDTWHYHHQNADFLALAKAVPTTTLVLDHCGTPLGVGRFAGRRAEIFKAWQDDMAALAAQPNVIAKLGGLAMPDNGWNWHTRETPPGSDEFANAYGDWYQHMIACFGPERCMFESNFPVDRASVSYGVLWNAFKKITVEFDEAAKDALFYGTALQVYGL